MRVLDKDKTNLEKEKKEMKGLTNYVLIPLTWLHFCLAQQHWPAISYMRLSVLQH